jgi:O-antigen/teichoic acid export membrane protein
MLLKLVSNKIIRFTTFTYLIYVLYFINSLIIANYLDAYYLGLWGFVNLVIQYLAQINFGISHSVNSIVSISKGEDDYIVKVLGNSISLFVFLSILVLLFFIGCYNFGFEIGEKFNFYNYLPFVLIVAVLAYFNSLISNIYRIYSRFGEIIFSQILYPLFTLIWLFFFRDENLLMRLTEINAVSSILIFIVLVFRCPLRIWPNIDSSLLKMILKKGLYLFLCNTSFYLIIISTRSFVSAYFKVTEFGYFTFAFTLANAVLLLIQSFAFLIYPKLLNRLSKYSSEKSYHLLRTVRNSYVVISHLLIHIAIFVVPYFLLLLPKYKSVFTAYHLIALTIVLYSNSFGFHELLISRGKEKYLGTVAVICLIFNVLMCYILIDFFGVPYYLVVISTMLTYVIYAFLVGRKCMRLLGLDYNLLNVLRDVYPVKILLPYLMSLFVFSFISNPLALIGPLILFVLLNFKSMLNMQMIFKMIMTNPEVVDI